MGKNVRMGAKSGSAGVWSASGWWVLGGGWWVVDLAGTKSFFRQSRL